MISVLSLSNGLGMIPKGGIGEHCDEVRVSQIAGASLKDHNLLKRALQK
jgi:hypothetical protein